MIMDKARNIKRRKTKENSLGLSALSENISNRHEKLKQQSLKELFAKQQQKLNLKCVSTDSSDVIDVDPVDANDIQHLSEISPNVISKDLASNDEAKSTSCNQCCVQSPDSKTLAEDKIDMTVKEFLDEDDSIFSAVVTEYASNLISQQYSTADNSSSINKQVHAPYYVENFKTIVKSVIDDTFFSYLFDNEDRSTLDLYMNDLTLSEQKLYTRLFLRKHRWLRMGQLQYNDIAEDISDIAEGLVGHGLFVNASELVELSDALKCLNANELKQIAKSLQISQSLTKPDLINAIQCHSKKNSIASFFVKNSSSIGCTVLNRVKEQIGTCYMLQHQRRSTFIRIMMLSSLLNTISDDDISGQQQIFQMLSTAVGLTKYPDYVVCRKSRVFKDQHALIKYGEILEQESNLWQKIEKKNYKDALIVYKSVKFEFENFIHDASTLEHILSLPIHLRVFTPGAAYIRILSRGVSVLQFLKQFDEAVIQLEELLSQPYYHQDYRGRWYDRLTLNLDFHLKRPSEAMKYVADALKDPFVRTGHRFDILQRGKKLLSTKNKKLNDVEFEEIISKDEMNSVTEAPNVTITGHQLPKPIPSAASVWIIDKTDFSVMTRVEQLALEHYAQNGYPEGIHGEGLTFTCLFMIFCWDVVFFDSIPDVFYNRFQTFPLDLRTDNFYIQRKSLFQERFELIEGSTSNHLEEMVEKCWLEHHGTLCSGLEWEVFRDLDHIKGLARCFGGKLLSGIFDRMARQMRFVTGGVPDLVVWNPDSNKIKFVEVKGPGDKLSSKQILWLDHLISVGADAEVCLVKAESSKKLKRKL